MKVRLGSPRGRLTIGLAIACDAVRAVALCGGRIAWALERARGEEPLTETIGQVLADAPLSRWPRPLVIAAVGPSHAQTKRLIGLPPVSDLSRLGDAVRESASRFFLRNGVPLLTTCRAMPEGALWGAAVEQPVVEAIEGACRAHRVKLAAIVPTVSVLGLAMEGASDSGRVVWRDGDISMEVTVERGALVALRRPSAVSSGSLPEGVASAALHSLGPDRWHFADALGAARARPSAVLAWRTGKRAREARSVSGWRLGLAVSAVLVTATAVLMMPGVGARFAEHRAAERLSSLAPSRRDVALAEREVAKVTAALTEVATFELSRYSMIRLLADLTRMLPDESALITLRVTRESGSLVALTPRAAAVLVKLERVPGIEGAEIVGPVTREVVAGKALERVTVRFRVSPEDRRGEPTTGEGAE